MGFLANAVTGPAAGMAGRIGTGGGFFGKALGPLMDKGLGIVGNKGQGQVCPTCGGTGRIGGMSETTPPPMTDQMRGLF